MGQIAIPIAATMNIPVGQMALIVTYAASACYTAPYGYLGCFIPPEKKRKEQTHTNALVFFFGRPFKMTPEPVT